MLAPGRCRIRLFRCRCIEGTRALLGPCAASCEAQAKQASAGLAEWQACPGRLNASERRPQAQKNSKLRNRTETTSLRL